MKKMTYLAMMLLAAVTLMSFSCEKEEDDPIVPEGITVADLVGNWNFVSLNFIGETYTDCDPDLNVTYNLTTLNLEITTSVLTITQECPDANTNLNDMPFTFADNIISTDGGRKFEIVNVDDFLANGNELKLKLIASNATDVPLYGIYTLN